MRCARPALIAPALLGLLASTGCYAPYPSSPYGPYGAPAGGYPGVGGQPIPTLQPGGTYAPSGVSPQGTFSEPTPADPSGGNAPFYNYNNSGSSTQNYEGGVPKYDDPDTIQFQEPQQQHHVRPGSTADDQTLDSFGSIEKVSGNVTGAARVDLDAAEFVAPVTAEADVPPGASVSITSAPYAYDTNYHWLRGVLRFDGGSGTWIMTYSSNPAADDPHAGKLVVADSPLLAPMKPHAVVLLRGEVDATLSESAGRAIYRADAVERVDLSLP